MIPVSFNLHLSKCLCIVSNKKKQNKASFIFDDRLLLFNNLCPSFFEEMIEKNAFFDIDNINLTKLKVKFMNFTMKNSFVSKHYSDDTYHSAKRLFLQQVINVFYGKFGTQIQINIMMYLK